MKNSFSHYWPSKRPDCVNVSTGAARTRLFGALFIALGVFGGDGCTTLGAKPWDHDLLAERAMQVGGYPIEAGMDDHIYFSKEASSGGRSFAGGGCGCN
jgi:hypothetical protein